MSRVFYGGIVPQGAVGEAPAAGGGPGAIELEIIRTVHCSRRPVYDGPTLLYYELTLEVIGVYNTAATAYQLPAVGADPLQNKFGSTPARTDNAIRDRLLTPRRKLVYTVGADVVHSSPPPGMKVDASNGPTPFAAEILEVIGEKTFIVRFGVRAYINPCPSVVSNTAAILSNRFAVERVVDCDGFSTLTTRGHAIFDTGKLDLMQNVPDDFTESFIRPLETGFRRDSVQVAAHEDGNQLTYCCVDRETALSMFRADCMRIEVYHTTAITRIGTLEGAESGFERGADVGNKVVPIIGGAIGALIGAVAGGTAGTIPKQVHDINIRVWGHRGQPKRNLENVGKHILAIILAQLGFSTVIKKIAAFSVYIKHDIAGRFIEIHGRYTMPPILQAIDAFEHGLGFGDQPLWPQTMPNDNIKTDKDPTDGDGGNYLIDLDDQRNVPDNRSLPGNLPGGVFRSKRARGAWIGQIVAQALTKTCQRQPAPKRGLKVNNGSGPAKDDGGT